MPLGILNKIRGNNSSGHHGEDNAEPHHPQGKTLQVITESTESTLLEDEITDDVSVSGSSCAPTEQQQQQPSSDNNNKEEARGTDSLESALIELQHEVREKSSQLAVLKDTLSNMSLQMKRKECLLQEMEAKLEDCVRQLDDKSREVQVWKQKYETQVSTIIDEQLQEGDDDQPLSELSSSAHHHHPSNINTNNHHPAAVVNLDADIGVDPLLGCRPWLADQSSEKNPPNNNNNNQATTASPLTTYDSMSEKEQDNNERDQSDSTDEDSICQPYGHILDVYKIQPNKKNTKRTFTNRTRPYKPKKPQPTIIIDHVPEFQTVQMMWSNRSQNASSTASRASSKAESQTKTSTAVSKALPTREEETNVATQEVKPVRPSKDTALVPQPAAARRDDPNDQVDISLHSSLYSECTYEEDLPTLESTTQQQPEHGENDLCPQVDDFDALYDDEKVPIPNQINLSASLHASSASVTSVLTGTGAEDLRAEDLPKSEWTTKQEQHDNDASFANAADNALVRTLCPENDSDVGDFDALYDDKVPIPTQIDLLPSLQRTASSTSLTSGLGVTGAEEQNRLCTTEMEKRRRRIRRIARRESRRNNFEVMKIEC